MYENNFVLVKDCKTEIRLAYWDASKEGSKVSVL